MTTVMSGSKTPCIICEKSMFHVVTSNGANGHIVMKDCIEEGNTFYIVPGYGSNFDVVDSSFKYEAIICDECLDKAIQSKRISITDWRKE